MYPKQPNRPYNNKSASPSTRITTTILLVSLFLSESITAQTNSATSAPTTTSPSTTPTDSPTHSPTSTPTSTPTNFPTASPTTTATPTTSPTTFSPTTASPTTSPTISPTQSPTTATSPTSSPTMAPPPFSVPELESLSYTVNPYTYYPVNWADVPTKPEETEVKVTVVGTCICDLTLFACDLNCCCDAECDSAEKETFSECKPDSVPPPSLDYCKSGSGSKEVALSSSGTLGVVSTAGRASKDKFLSSQLCIVHDNNPDLGRFFQDPSPAGASGTDLDQALAAGVDNQGATKSGSGFFSDTFEYFPDATDTSGTSRYMVGDKVQARYQVVAAGGNQTMSLSGPSPYLTLPAPVLTAQCQDMGLAVEFGVNVPPSSKGPNDFLTCLRSVEAGDLPGSCQEGSAISGDLVNQLMIGALKSSASDFFPVTITSLWSQSVEGGLKVPHNVSDDGIPTPEYDPVTGVCSAALLEVSLTLIHDGRGTLTAANAQVVMTDLIQEVGQPLAFNQRFKVQFLKDGDEALARPSSGSPGYFKGYPLLAGMIADDPEFTSSKQAVHRLVEGLPVSTPHESDGTCRPTSQDSVRFGVNTLTRCRVPLTLQGLEAFCKGEGDLSYSEFLASTLSTTTSVVGLAPRSLPPLPVQLLRGLLYSGTGRMEYSGNRTFIAAWADANAENLAEWETNELELLDTPSAMTWDVDKKQCTNVVTGLTYEFLTTLVGQIQNPQSKVAYARVSYKYGTWRFANQRAAALEPGTVQNFSLEHTVQFVPIQQEGPTGIVPDAPPLFPDLPEDAFYPFVVSSTDQVTATWTVLGCLLLIQIAALLP